MSIEWINVPDSSEYKNDYGGQFGINSHTMKVKDETLEDTFIEYRYAGHLEDDDDNQMEGNSDDHMNIDVVKCPDCDKIVVCSQLYIHQQTDCHSKRKRKRKLVHIDEVTTCHLCSQELSADDVADHYLSCEVANGGAASDKESNSKQPTKGQRTKSKFSSRKVIDIVELHSNNSYKSRVTKDENDSICELEDDECVSCPECSKVFSDHQGRDEHLVYSHHYHFRIRFNNRESFWLWFKGMRFDQIMYKANMSTVNNVTYEYYFCLYTAVSRRVRIRDRCPCRAFVKENQSGIVVSYLDVHSHPQLKYKRYMTDECRSLILGMLEKGKRNKEILRMVRDQFSESSINYTIARTTINSIRFNYKKRLWASKNVDIKALQSTLNEEVARERRKMAALWPNEGEDDLCETIDRETQTTFSIIQHDPELFGSSTVSTREGKEEVVDNILNNILPGLKLAVRNPSVTVDQLHTARVHLSKVIKDLNPSRRVDTDHDYTYLCDK